MKLLDLLFPRACLLCRAYTARTSHCCAPCEGELPILPESCPKCAEPRLKNDATPCAACALSPPPLTRVIIPFLYEGAVRRLIMQLKFHAALHHTPLFVHALTQAVLREPLPHPDLILPLPLHRNRLKKRGFNQVRVVAQPLAHALNLPFDGKCLIRLKDTPPQHTLSAPLRATNLTEAFASTRSLAGAHVALVDDVMTTGHTLKAAALTLLGAGARRVDAWCFARALRPEVAERPNNR